MQRWSFLLPVLMVLGCPDAPTPPGQDLDGDGWPDATDPCVDVDGDGYGRPESDTSGCVVSTADCDDTDAQTYPDAPEICDARDNDCDELIDEELDVDGDGFTSCGPDGVPGTADDDCNDASADVYPAAPELCDGLDNDCDGEPSADEVDADGDGFPACEGTDVAADCDDGDASSFPGAPELCDGLDNDCDGEVPADESDNDGDGTTPCAGDCDDADAASYPGAVELCDGLDNDCDGDVPGDEEDADGDGVSGCEGDCDDGDPTLVPGADEGCDGVDTNCDGIVPEGELDADGDGIPVCDGDCDDADAAVHPGANEACDGVDNDCDGAVPDLELDADGDGAMVCEGDCDDGDPALNPLDGDGDGISTCGGDCDDADAAIHPGAAEACNNLDDDCDAIVPGDEVDADGDGWPICDGDCDDADPARYPGAGEACDGIDNDCDGVVPADEEDGDGDGYTGCDGDCDDADPAVSPDAEEVCNGTVDDDCNPATDELGDVDGDGFSLCTGDCDDWSSTVHPGAEELCNGVDDDCDLAVDDALDGDGDGDDICVDCNDYDPLLNHADADGDGETSCDGDCDDGDPSVYSGAPQACDGIADNDCDGITDPNEEDGDGDGVSGCGGDCDDADPDAFPGAVEVQCDGLDQDCDGVDELPESVSLGLYAADSYLSGDQAEGASGTAVAIAGDVNDDGFADILIAAQAYDGQDQNSGKVFLVYGPAETPVSLASADAAFEGEGYGAYLNEIAAAGDVNGDGFADILFGAGDDDEGGSQSGKAYVVLGPPDPVMVPVATYHGEAASNVAGSAVAGAGDVDADGYDDVLIGANGYSGNTGAVYLVYGPMSGDESLAAADIRFTGESGGDRMGAGVAGAGDVNGDGYADVLMGAYGASHLGVGGGKAYLINGPVDHDVPVASADAMFYGEMDYDYAGIAVAGAGDVNGDGNDDVLVGAYANDEAGNLAGKTYLLLGPLSGWIGLASADATFLGESAEDKSGRQLAGAGDVDGDGYDDFLIGAYQNDGGGANAGRAYLFFGPQSGAMDVDDATAVLTGEYAGDSAGASVAGGGDVDGDGLDDILIGATGFDLVGSGSGMTYLLTGPVVCN
jgi:hypothetical protein